MNLAFEAHQDDIALFAAYVTMDHHARVVTVLESHVQAARGLPITQQMRRLENDCAMRELGVEWEQWPYRDDSPDWDAVLAAMRVADDLYEPEVVIAPAWESEGHEHHNRLADLTDAVFGARVVRYLTYQRGHGRSEGTETVGTADQIRRKFRALACYRSQIAEPSCTPWFLDGMTEQLV